MGVLHGGPWAVLQPTLGFARNKRSPGPLPRAGGAFAVAMSVFSFPILSSPLALPACWPNKYKYPVRPPSPLPDSLLFFFFFLFFRSFLSVSSLAMQFKSLFAVAAVSGLAVANSMLAEFR